MRNVTLGVTQFASDPAPGANADRAEALVRRAAAEGAQVILLQELFAGPISAYTQQPQLFATGRCPREGHPLIARFADLARELGVVLPVSFFERAGPVHFNSVAMVDADGRGAGPLPQKPYPARAGL